MSEEQPQPEGFQYVKETPKAKTDSLSWDNDSMTWRNARREVVSHPRYANSPRSLEGKSFIKGYLRAVGHKKSLNEYMKTNQKFTAAEVQKAAKEFRKILTAATGESFELLKRRKSKSDRAAAKKKKAVQDSLSELRKLGLDV
jgi:hypothetical protein